MQKIAILGGGVGSMTAAYALTSEPGWRERYEVTLYQVGWRLGGKGTTGRNPFAGDRIQEHGLHVWLGFYDNAFRTMRDCYEELNRPPGMPLRTWTEAFQRFNSATLAEYVNGSWKLWKIELPVNDEVPGDGGELLKPWSYVQMLLQWLLEAMVGPTHQSAVERVIEAVQASRNILHVRTEVHSWVSTTAASTNPDHHRVLAWLVDHLHEARELLQAMPGRPEHHAQNDRNRLVDLVTRFFERFRERVIGEIEAHDTTRRLFILAELAVAGVRGLIADNVIEDGFAAADEMDFRAWLSKHGASELAVSSAPVREVYDLCFAYHDGQLDKPDIAAGTAMEIILKMCFAYKGSAMYKMEGGMGDTIFVPLYEVLKKRGVRFEFFHRVRKLELSEDKSSISRIQIDRQVNLKDGVAEYSPLRTVRSLPCWPDAPLFEQLKEGEEIREKGIDLESSWNGWKPVEAIALEAGRDFDHVVLGISIAAFPSICSELIEADEKWRLMVDGVKSVQTQAVQLWFDPTLAELGYPDESPMVGTYAEPLDTWADLSELLPRENWAEPAPKTIIYLCGPKTSGIDPPETDTSYPAREAHHVRETTIDWLNQNFGGMLPDGAPPDNPKGIDWQKLHAPEEAKNEERLDHQYLRANIDPSERYVLSVAGSTKFRLRSGASGFSNLFLAGDWVKSGINAGCVEAAVMTGLAASRAICGSPQTIIGWNPDE